MGEDMWSKILLLGVGGFVGSNLRYWISTWSVQLFGATMPYGTFIVNAVGSFILGFLTIYGTEVIQLDPRMRLLIGTGMMGALTTFSTFSFETFMLIRQSKYFLALINIGANVLVALLAVYIGFIIAKAMA